MKILNFGSCNIDYVYSLDHIVEIGETERSSELNIFSGGKGLNQSIALARAGTEIYHAGAIGNDGDFLLKTLIENGVNTDFLKISDCKTGHAIIQVSNDGDNSIFLYPGSNEMIKKEDIDEVLSHFSKDDIILLQNEINNVDYIIKQAYKRGMQIVFNPSPYNEKINEIDFDMISYLLLNEVEARCISQYDKKEGILEFFAQTYPNLKVVLTLGKDGCVFQHKTDKIAHSAFNVNVVDTTAAGDTFTGYFVASLINRKQYKEILKLASAASAVAITKNGAAPSIPYMSEVIDFVKHQEV